MNNQGLFLLLNKNEVKIISKIFEKEGIELRLVGGSVRDALLTRNSNDIDFATNNHPDKIIDVLKQNNIKYNDYAKDYGSINFYLNKIKFEITSLRKDINQQGRKTEIVYTQDWEVDASRRDFTINAIYLTSDGKIFDYFDGLKDIQEKKIKFINDIKKSINEDFLRIFRYYRFLGIFEKPLIISYYEKILHSNILEAYNVLSHDIIRVEILKMLKNPFPLNSFCEIKNLRKKNYWLKITHKYFLNSKYTLGLDNCLNKVEDLF